MHKDIDGECVSWMCTCKRFNQAPPDPPHYARFGERERFFIYWLLRAYEALSRVGWEEGPSSDETRDRLCDVLANLGVDPNLSADAKAILAEKPRYIP